jgi:hypothetical protein
MNEPKLKLTLKPCDDCWLHIDAPSGLKASINLGQRGSMNDQTIVGRTIREVAELCEENLDILESADAAPPATRYGLTKGQLVHLICEVSEIKDNCVVAVRPRDMGFPSADFNVHRNDIIEPNAKSIHPESKP